MKGGVLTIRNDEISRNIVGLLGDKHEFHICMSFHDFRFKGPLEPYNSKSKDLSFWLHSDDLEYDDEAQGTAAKFVIEERLNELGVDDDETCFKVVEGIAERCMLLEEEQEGAYPVYVSIELGVNPETVKAALASTGIKWVVSGRDFVLPCDRCSICFEDYMMVADGVEFAKLPCSHVFHSGCIIEWVNKSRIPSCPLCRSMMQ